MKTKSAIIFLLLFVIISASGQSSLNNYKYVIVPKKFDFLKEADQYQLNSLTKFLLDKENFTTFFDDESFPEDLVKDRCLALEANVIDDSGLFKTKLTLQLEDCRKNILFTSRQGDSKEKEYQKAYYESLREAFQTFQTINYAYNPQQRVIQDNVKPVKQPVLQELPEEKPVNTDPISKVISEPKLELEKPVSPEPPQKEEPEVIEVVKPVETRSVEKESVLSDILYAQIFPNGFQLVDSSPKVVYTIYYSGKKDVFIVKGKDALIYKLNDTWVYAENKGDKLDVNSIKIKF